MKKRMRLKKKKMMLGREDMGSFLSGKKEPWKPRKKKMYAKMKGKMLG